MEIRIFSFDELKVQDLEVLEAMGYEIVVDGDKKVIVAYKS